MRYEEKYYINYNDYYYINKLLSSILKKDPNQIDGNGYFVRSLYFDNLFNKNFIEKKYGLNERKKIRMRLYDIKSDLIKFEIKYKIKSLIKKEAATITKEDAYKIILGQDINCLLKYNNNILNKIYYTFKRNYYKPVVIVDYTRKAFVFPFNDVRITFDTLLKKNEIDLDIFSNINIMVPFLKNKIIMEIKYNKIFPKWIKNVLKISNFEKCAISKYCLSRTI